MEQLLAQQRVANSRILRTENRIKELQTSVVKMFEALDINIQSHLSSFEKTIQKLDKSLAKDNKKILDKLEKQFSSISSVMVRINQNIENNTKLVDGLTEYANEQASQMDSKYDTSEEELEAARKQDKQIELLTKIVENTEHLKVTRSKDDKSIFDALKNIKMPNIPLPFGSPRNVPQKTPPTGANGKPQKTPPVTPVPVGDKDGKKKNIFTTVREKVGTAGSKVGEALKTVGGKVGSGVMKTGGAIRSGIGATAGMFGPIGAALAAFKAVSNVMNNKELADEWNKEDSDLGVLAAKGGEEVAKGIISGLSLGLISEDMVGTFIKNVREKYLSPEFFDALFGSFDKLLKNVEDFGKSFEKMYDDFAVKFGIKKVSGTAELSEDSQRRYSDPDTRQRIVDDFQATVRDKENKSQAAQNMERASFLLKSSRQGDIDKGMNILKNLSPDQVSAVAANVTSEKGKSAIQNYMAANNIKTPAPGVSSSVQQAAPTVVNTVNTISNNTANNNTNVAGGIKQPANPSKFVAT